MTNTCSCLAPRLPTPWPIHATMLFFIILLLVQSHEGSANLGETCKCGVASAVVDAVVDATAATIGTDSDDTVDVAASTAGLSRFAIQ